VNVSSLAGAMPPAAGPDYSASKAAMNNMTVSLSKAAAGDGVTVNAISPGTILTPKLEAAFRKMAESNGWVDGEATWSEIERAVLGPSGRRQMKHAGSWRFGACIANRGL